MKNDQAAHRVLLYWAGYLQKYARDMDSMQKYRPVESIFARMSLSEGRSNKPMSARYLFLRLLSEQISYPGDQSEPGEDDNKMIAEWKSSVCENTVEELEKMSVSDILFWLEMHGSYVPAGDDITVSLYDRAKTKTAIATCLNHPDICGDEPFLLVAGDFSGMQDFIYTISSQGALKTLRARSFFLEMLAQHVIYEILNIESLRLNRTNLIYSGGGMFYLLLPNNEDAKTSLETVKTEINNWLFEEHSAQLYLGLKWIPTTKDAIESDATKTWSGVIELLDDLFIVGAWSDVAELAFDVQKCFDAYTCKNPDISISGGMITQQPKFPIYQMARIAGDAENSAKGNRAECQEEKCRKDWSKCSLRDYSGECGRKNSIALLYDVAIASEAAEMKEELEEPKRHKSEKPAERIKVALTWDKAGEYVLELVKLLKETGKNEDSRISPDALPRGFTYKVFEVINIWRGQGVLYLPTFAW